MSGLLRPTSTAGREEDLIRALSVPTADPVWLLARQWQTGAFVATDGGSPVLTSLTWSSGPLRFAGAELGAPLEPAVEAERKVPVAELDVATRVALSVELLRRVRESISGSIDLAGLFDDWATAYPLRVEDGLPAPSSASPVGAMARRLPDPAQLVAELVGVLQPDGSGDPMPPLPRLQVMGPSAAAEIEGAVRGWYAWVCQRARPDGSGPVGADPAAWLSDWLAYTYECTVELPASRLHLVANDYDGTGMEWYGLRRNYFGEVGIPGSSTTRSAQVRPARVSYPGMPRPRWWEFEDGDVNLDSLRASEDPARAVLARFAHDYSNDWFLIPVEVESGWSLINSVQVTDTFGTLTDAVSVAELDGDQGPWRMWEVTSDTPDAAAGLRVWWPIAPPFLEGPVIEEVLLAKDEMANLAWLIELKTMAGDGTVVDRYNRWLELRPEAAAGAGWSPAGGDAASYRLGTTIPDFWYPLLSTESPNGTVLVLAQTPDGARDVADHGVQGVLVDHVGSAELVPELITRQGRRVARRWRLMVGPDGVQTWLARMHHFGSGEASSGLRFDLVS